jgi:hypothetical protein
LKPLKQFPKPSTVTMEQPSREAMGARQALIHLEVIFPACSAFGLSIKCSMIPKNRHFLTPAGHMARA